MKSEEYSQLLSGSVSSVNAMEGEVLHFYHIISIQAEEMTHACMVNAALQESWNRMTSTHAELRSQLASAARSGTSEQQGSPTRNDEDRPLRDELIEASRTSL